MGGDSPEFPTDTIPKPGDDQSDPKVQARLQRAIEAGRDAQRIRPMLYLLTTVQATPQATRSLYAQIGHFETLERLPNVEVDGRVALRIRFDGVNLGTHRERVLVIDASTGAPIRTESVDRSSYTEIARAHRVAAVGAASIICAEKFAPCELLAGTGPLAAELAAYVQTERGRRDTQFMKDPSNAFAITRPLRDRDRADSVYGAYTGECSRDARMLSTCRG
ncbi:MAG: hypothetical protein H7287_01905 [Thermoleophilia bacterium]|nr:hypothetical protein [Thermoleophilia bacterium]